MIRSPILLLLLVLASMLGSVSSLAQTRAPGASVVNASEPNALIETAANAMVSELESRRAELRKDPAKLGELVDRILLPHFDVNHAARLVLGKHWRSATPEQRQQFIDAFYGSLMSNYGDALLEFTGDRIKVLPTPVPADAVSASVRTEVRRSNGTRVPVNYSLRKTEAGWKVWDVVIEGISYVKSFREDFGAEIDQKGLDAVIDRLQAQNRGVGRQG
ncbi:MAG: ABC transporter substrate-binding protein [Gammaproteobacteria bacterium]|jgi:phospholipid transport system substrate-binding protein|nr:ABC transporter substrate-binding protein [Gammaproteobacteria bacterium]